MEVKPITIVLVFPVQKGHAQRGLTLPSISGQPSSRSLHRASD